jgi:hypothetical protein
MNIQDCSPLKARHVFKLRPYKNFGIGLVVFAPICFPLLLCVNVWVASGIAFLPALCLYCYLESRVIVIECPSCGKDIDTNTPWLCGYKQCRNENVDHEHPFINECEHCQYIPKAYECHHCNRLIYLTTDRQQIHAAKCLVAPEPLKVRTVVKDVIGDKVATQKEEVRDLEHQLKRTVLEKQIEIEKNKQGAPVTKTPEQELEDEIGMDVNQGMSLYAVEQRLKAKADVEFPKDEHKRQQKYALIERAIANRMDS